MGWTLTPLTEKATSWPHRRRAAAAAAAMYGARKWLAPLNRIRLYLEKLGLAQASELVALVAVLCAWTGLTLLYS